MHLFLKTVLEVTQMTLIPRLAQTSHMAILIPMVFEGTNFIDIVILNKGFHLSQPGLELTV